MYAHIEACKNSCLPQKNYCEQESLAYSTFQYWVKKYREEFAKDEATAITPGFIPIEVHPDPEVDPAGISNQLPLL